MQPAPSPSAGRGDAVLQPSFFTSNLYVQPLRDDISTLTNLFRKQYSLRDSAVSPFSTFKQLWRSEGWKWLHFKVFDDRARETFLHATIRLFLEQVMKEDPITRVVGLFGAYLFYYTQPEDTAPKLYRVNHIPIPVDHFGCITSFSESLLFPEVVSLRQPVIYIVSTMVKDQVFYILPPSKMGPENPRYLPREVLVGDSSSDFDLEAPKKKGRPSWRDKARKAQLALEGLDSWLNSTQEGSAAGLSGYPIPYDIFAQYQDDKSELISALESSGDEEAITQANIKILGRLLEAQATQRENDAQGSSVGRRFRGVERVEKAVQQLGTGGRRGGVLGLLEGAGEWRRSCP